MGDGASVTDDQAAAGEDEVLARRVRRGPVFVLSQVVDLALVAIVVAVMFDPRFYVAATAAVATLQWTVLWVLLGMIHLIVRITRARRARLGDPMWPYRLNGRVTGYLVQLATVVMIVSSALAIALRPALLDLARSLPDAVLRSQLTNAANLSAIVALPVVFVAWAMLHAGYAERYARIWLRSRGDPPIVFPGTTAPTLLDFVYFSFTVGVAVSTSDCVIRSDHVRGVVTRHAVLSFVYSSVILGIVIGLVT
ncbi:DUF1345 domain-containing protein [Pseudonocardia endophytica]|uniref:Uncharacterized protein DUF1345 n=1 Tax=Pseudonocardia endophytica TaxID=401976 RepID=A0A4R1HRL4_PSEEN|nr:DUF1345 domain-containing protein [Pseudonocardia endophytica]TCK25254.1 uncharacterized protein DUF1345 [Pseudonocardia endophytica]